ncbi:unnamed protein product (macronuclear) [Paramecium tetraurelia]|uniref:Mini antigen n=1 Tax=Paramecium tetraurelia TaxID=5888 RepID=A0BQS1_PARTE|nr:uncharacterized protein GSPATT00031117001 [Paramecium tetraurelia]CAK60888.1 unnamed protein product [Paramecium tetraurelia]|eukprot:XP_001428286.1 hypothetical protein (macronuclear) [Paramecium tetraurelia strain d4-2]
MKLILLFICIGLSCCSVPLVCSEAKKEKDCLEIINGINECVWTGGQCEIKTCEMLKPPCDGEAYSGYSCSNSKLGCKTVKQCSDIEISSSCSVVTPFGKQCIWEQGCRIRQCKDNTQETCTVTNGQLCMYQNNQCTLITGCADIVEVDKCETDDYHQNLSCAWKDGRCQKRQCDMIANEEECFKTVVQSERCFYGQITEQQSGCLSCSIITDSCLCDHYNLFGCAWKQDHCYKQSCETFTNIDQCNSAYDSLTCTWYVPLNKCMTIDDANTLDRQCDIYSFSSGIQLLLMVILLMF